MGRHPDVSSPPFPLSTPYSLSPNPHNNITNIQDSHLNELAPPAFRASFPGITYQLGNMISSPSAQIVNELAESHLIRSAIPGKRAPAYGPTMGIATAIIALGIVVTTAFGPEKRGARFEQSRVAGAEMHDQTMGKRGSFGEDEEGKVESVTIEHVGKQ